MRRVQKSFSLNEFLGDTKLGSLPCGEFSRSEKILCNNAKYNEFIKTNYTLK